MWVCACVGTCYMCGDNQWLVAPCLIMYMSVVVFFLINNVSDCWCVCAGPQPTAPPPHLLGQETTPRPLPQASRGELCSSTPYVIAGWK